MTGQVLAQAQDLFRVRDATEADVPFVSDTWKHSYRKGGLSPNCAGVLYWEGQHALVARLLSRSMVRVAFNPHAPGQLFGWCCFEAVDQLGVLHFVYVKAPFRGYGIARELVSAVANLPGLQHSHRTKDGERLCAALNSTWNPYLLGGIG